MNAYPDRFQGFATLATPAPAAAAQELERAVTKLGLNGALLFGRTGERNLDHPDNWPIFEAAASLRAPLYIHPQVPQPRVRAALYAGFDDAIDNAFATLRHRLALRVRRAVPPARARRRVRPLP